VDHIELRATDTPPPRAADYAGEAACPQSFIAAFIATAPIGPIAAAMITVAAYSTPYSVVSLWGDALPEWVSRLTSHPLVAALLNLLAAWLLLSIVYRLLGFTAANRANAASYDGLWDRLRGLQAQCEELCAESHRDGSRLSLDSPLKRSASKEACAHRDAIERGLRSGGPQWVLGTGYAYLWERVDRAEEALIDVKPRPAVIADGMYDRLRCAGSSIENQEELRARLEGAVGFLRTLGSPSGDLHHHPDGDMPGAGATVQQEAPARVTAQPARRSNGEQVVEIQGMADDPAPLRGDPAPVQSGPARADTSQPKTPIGMDLPTSEAEARTILRQVRRSINGFRQDRWAGLVRARNHLALAKALTSFLMYVLLWLAIIDGVSPVLIGAAAAFFLVGAVVGLFNECYNDSQAGTVVDDYGLTSARLLMTPLVSGLAAVAGVLIVSMLSVSQLRLESDPRVSLADLFDVQNHPFNFIVAATFWLTPGLLLDRLKQQTEQYKQDLQSSKAAGTSAGQ
jgi:hypothetical protein